MLDIALGVCLSVKGDALDVTVLGAVVFCNDFECATCNLNLSLVEERSSEPVASRSRLNLIESERREDIP